MDGIAEEPPGTPTQALGGLGTSSLHDNYFSPFLDSSISECRDESNTESCVSLVVQELVEEVAVRSESVLSRKSSDSTDGRLPRGTIGRSGSQSHPRSKSISEEITENILAPARFIGDLFSGVVRGGGNEDPVSGLKSNPSFRELDAMTRRYRRKLELDAKAKALKNDARRTRERKLSETSRFWVEDVIPKWEEKKCSAKVQKAWLRGLPPNVRGQLWQRAIGNGLSITESTFVKYSQHAQEMLESGHEAKVADEKRDLFGMKCIEVDLSRTFPQLSFFQQGEPYHEHLRTLLLAYAAYRPDIGYVQGMSYLTAMFLIVMTDVSPFECFATLCNFLDCDFFTHIVKMDIQVIHKRYFKIFDKILLINCPQIARHFEDIGITTDMFLIEWLLTLFCKSVPLDIATRVWDCFIMSGELVLYRTAVAILRMYSSSIMNSTLEDCLRIINKLPDDMDEEELFEHIMDIAVPSSVEDYLAQFTKGHAISGSTVT